MHLTNNSLLFIVLILHLLTAQSGTAGTLEIFGETVIEGLLPASFIDHSDFELPKDFAKIGPGLDSKSVTLPLFPMWKSSFSLRKFIGIVIPHQYLEKAGALPCNNEARRGSVTVISMGVSFDPLVTQAMDIIRKLQIPGETKNSLVPIYLNCNLYGILDTYSVEIGNLRTFGLSLVPGSETIHLGERFTLGLEIHFGKDCPWPLPLLNQPSHLEVGSDILVVLTFSLGFQKLWVHLWRVG